jgi:hypothetical protein
LAEAHVYEGKSRVRCALSTRRIDDDILNPTKYERYRLVFITRIGVIVIGIVDVHVDERHVLGIVDLQGDELRIVKPVWKGALNVRQCQDVSPNQRGDAPKK